MYISERKRVPPSSNHLLRGGEAIIIGNISSSKVYRVFTSEDKYVVMIRDLTFLIKTSILVATTHCMITKDPKPEPGSTP
jgi:hypothetical protein